MGLCGLILVGALFAPDFGLLAHQLPLEPGAITPPHAPPQRFLERAILNKNRLPSPATFRDQTLLPIADWLRQHPRRVGAAVGALLLGTGVTAFGLAPLAQDLDSWPVHQVTENLSLGESFSLLPAQGPSGLVLYRSDTVRRDDTLHSLLQRLGVNDAEALAFLRNDPWARQLLGGRVGKGVTVETNEHHALKRLTARWLDPRDESRFQRLVVQRQGDTLVSQMESAPLTTSVRLASGEIQSSLFAATDQIRLPDLVAVQLAEIFSAAIDFRRDLRRGDRFSLVYETLEADGEPLRSGRILSAEFINDGKAHHAVWFDAQGHQGGYYNFDGESSIREYLASPLAFTRVSSGYGMRFHPVHGDRRAHLGVDYAAPTGTAVRTIGDGVVQFAGWQRGYGNVVFIAHRKRHTTVYAHLSRIDVRQGQRVEQGESVGAVGCTGVCTGPHLHFEFRDNGVPTDPLVALRNSESVALPTALRPQFEAVATLQRQKLDAASTLRQASAE